MPDLTQEGLAARGLRVKALAFLQDEAGRVTPDGRYIVAQAFGAWRVWFHSDPLRDTAGRPITYDDEPSAISAANQHNAARILAALEDTGEPALIREAEARGMERAAGIAYRVCAETRHVTLGQKAEDEIRAALTASGAATGERGA